MIEILQRATVVSQQIAQVPVDSPTPPALEKEFDALIKEYISLIKKDPEMYAQLKGVIDDLENQLREDQQRNKELEQAPKGKTYGVFNTVVDESSNAPEPSRPGSSNSKPPVTSEIKVSPNNIRPNPQAPQENVQDYKTRNNPQQVYQQVVKERQQQGERYRQQHIEFTDYVYNSFNPSPTCSFPASFNVNIPLSQYFDKELCANSINGQMPWSKPTTFPGTNIQFQYSLLFYCKVPPATLGDQMALVMDDYAFVRIVNKNELVAVRGKIEFDYLDSEGVERTSFERFVIEPGKMQEELGMWYLACKFRRVRLVELSCK